MRDSGRESGLNINLIVPIALLAVLLIVPFSINSLLHFFTVKRQFTPVIMKIPVDSSAINLSHQAKQYESFEVSLNLQTEQLAKFINEIVSTAAEGTSYQGIVGHVSTRMKAEIAGDNWIIDLENEQEPISSYRGSSNWRWRVTPTSSGNQELAFYLHLSIQDGNRLNNKTIDLAEANFLVEANWSEWFKRNGIWASIILTIATIVAFRWHRHRIRSKNLQ